MREIKFRAWDTFRNEMKEVISIEYPTNEDAGGLITFKDKSDCFFADVILLQLTGLKDKNGKEIFEGDIVQCMTKTKDNFIHRDTLMFGWSRDDEYGLIWSFSKCIVTTSDLIDRRYKVIGNIYENPELLSSKDTEEKQ